MASRGAVDVFWNDAGIRAGLLAALQPAATQVGAAAKAAVKGSKSLAGSIRVIVRGGVAYVFSRDPRAPWWERGIGAHEVAPKGEALKLSGTDQGFVRSGIRHPGMAPRPFLSKVPPLFPAMYRAAALARLARF